MHRKHPISTYSSRGDDELDLALVSAHEDAELFSSALEDAQSVVLGEGLEEVLDGVALVLHTDALLDLGDNLRLIRGAERWSSEDLRKLAVLLEDGRQVLEGLGGAVKGVGLGCGRVLEAHICTSETCPTFASMLCLLSFPGSCVLLYGWGEHTKALA